MNVYLYVIYVIGWECDERDDVKVLGKRNLYTYRGPNGSVETSMKRAMKQIRLGVIAWSMDVATCVRSRRSVRGDN